MTPWTSGLAERLPGCRRPVLFGRVPGHRTLADAWDEAADRRCPNRSVPVPVRTTGPTPAHAGWADRDPARPRGCLLFPRLVRRWGGGWPVCNCHLFRAQFYTLSRTGKSYHTPHPGHRYVAFVGERQATDDRKGGSVRLSGLTSLAKNTSLGRVYPVFARLDLRAFLFCPAVP